MSLAELTPPGKAFHTHTTSFRCSLPRQMRQSRAEAGCQPRELHRLLGITPPPSTAGLQLEESQRTWGSFAIRTTSNTQEPLLLPAWISPVPPAREDVLEQEVLCSWSQQRGHTAACHVWCRRPGLPPCSNPLLSTPILCAVWRWHLPAHGGAAGTASQSQSSGGTGATLRLCRCWEPAGAFLHLPG